MNRFCLICLGVVLLAHGRATAGCPTLEYGGAPLLSAANGDKQVVVTLHDPPARRLRLSLDSDTGAHEEVEWDPAVSSEMSRRLTLGAGTWQVAPSIEPEPYTQNAGTVVIYATFALSAPRLTATYFATMASAAASPPVSSAAVGHAPTPTLTFACAALPTMEGMRFPSTSQAGASGLRGFGVAPEAVSETLSILAEIAVERAKAGALKALKKRLVDPFCVDDTRITLARLGLGHGDSLALPRTCELLVSLRLNDILSSGKPLLFALRDDLRHTIAPALIAEMEPRLGAAAPALRAMLTVAGAALDRGGADLLDSQVLLAILGDFVHIAGALDAGTQGVVLTGLDDDALQPLMNALSVALNKGPCANAVSCRPLIETTIKNLLDDPLGTWKEANSTVEPKLIALLSALIDRSDRAKDLADHACQARLAVATIKRCSKDGCDADTLADMLAHPEQHFAVDTTLPLAICWKPAAGGTSVYRETPAKLAEVKQLVLEGLHVVAPVLDSNGRDRAKAAIRLVAHWMGGARDTTGCDCVEGFAEIAIALIDEDYGTALTRFVRLADKLRPTDLPPELRKIAQLVGAVAAYSAVYRDTKDQDPAAARAARKEALSSIIDSATDRTDREDAVIFSIGSNVGMSATWTDRFGMESSPDPYEPVLRVPLGFAVEWPAAWPVAPRLGVQLADLGQFVRRGDDDELDDVRWADFVSPGLEGGLSINCLAPGINLTGHVAYAPSLALDDATPDGVWRYGVSINYYVPFFDLN